MCLPHLSEAVLLSLLYSNLSSSQKQQHRAIESIVSCLALGTSRVLWHEHPAGVHADACLPLSLALQSQITLDMIMGSKVEKQEPAAGEASQIQ